jgi:hypothetical protein
MKAFVLLFCVALIACGSATRIIPQACPSSGIDRAIGDLPIAYPPKPVELFVPPLPIPDDVIHRRATIRLVIDTLGHAMADSVTVCGIPNARYTQRLAQGVAALRFRPQLVAGRPVVAPVLIVYDF